MIGKLYTYLFVRFILYLPITNNFIGVFSGESTNHNKEQKPIERAEKLEVNSNNSGIISKTVAAATRVILEQTFETLLSTPKGKMKPGKIAKMATHAALNAAAHEFLSQQFIAMCFDKARADWY